MISINKFIDNNYGKSLDVPWGYRGQCVSLVQRYLNEYYGVLLERKGDAKDYGYNLVNSCYAKEVRTSDMRYGDIIILGKPFSYIEEIYSGHIAIVIDKRKIFDQNNLMVEPTTSALYRPMFRDAPLQVIRMIKQPLRDKPKKFSFVKGQKLQTSGYYPTVHNGSFIVADGMLVLVERIYKDDNHRYGVTDTNGC